MRPRSTYFRWLILYEAFKIDRKLRRQRIFERLMRKAQPVTPQSRINLPLRLSDERYWHLPDSVFVDYFRLSKPVVRLLMDDLVAFIPKQRRKDGFSPTLKMLIALAYYSSGAYQNQLGQKLSISVSQASVSRAVQEVTEALNHPKIFQKYVAWPKEESERNIIKQKFSRYGIPGLIGCIEGTHIPIIRHNVNDQSYTLNKGFHSVHVLIICDSMLNVTCVDASHPGKAKLSYIWEHHPLNHHLMELYNAGEQVLLLGEDRGYALQPTLMTPIKGESDCLSDLHYYSLQMAARNLVDECIVVLKARFRCLLGERPLRYNPIMAGKIINACCVLHNLANKYRMPFPPLSPKEAAEERKRRIGPEPAPEPEPQPEPESDDDGSQDYYILDTLPDTETLPDTYSE